MKLFHYFTILAFVAFGSACAGLSKIATNIPTQTTEGGQGGDNPYNGSGLTEHGDETEGAEETDDGATDDDGEDAMDPTEEGVDDGSDDTAETPTDDGTTEVATAEPEEGGDNAPVVMLPAPTSENATPTNDTECVYVGATDEEEELPIVASEDCVYCLDMETGERVECDPEDWILVASDEELDEEATALLMPKENKASPAPTMLARVVNWFLPFGNPSPLIPLPQGARENKTPSPSMGEGWGEGVFPVANATDSDTPEPALCSEEGISCCNITPTGSFECFHERSAANRGDDVYLYFIKKNPDANDDGEIDEDAETIASGTIETPNSKILYTMQAAVHSAQGASSNIYTLASTRGLELMDDGRWFVKGDHESNYEKFEASASKLAFDKYIETFGFLNSTDGIKIYSEADGTIASKTETEATGYTALINTENGPYYGIATEETDEAYVYFGYDWTILEPMASRTIDNSIPFITSTDGLKHTETNLIAQNEDGFFLVLYKDETGAPRLRMSDGSTMFGGTSALSSSYSTYDFKDLQFVDNDRAFLLDAENNKVWIIRTNTTTSTVTTTLTVGITVPKPIAMVTDSTKSMAYILSESSNRVFAVSLGSRPEITGSIGLGDIFAKPFHFKPVTIAMSDDDSTVLVGCDSKIKSTLVVDMSPLIVAPVESDTAGGSTTGDTTGGGSTSGGGSTGGSSTGGSTGGGGQQPSGNNQQQPNGGGGITPINPNMPHL